MEKFPNKSRRRKIESTGKYKCMVCDNVWEGSQLLRGTCGNAFCGANVDKINDKPKENQS
jgi:hypothetical protein